SILRRSSRMGYVRIVPTPTMPTEGTGLRAPHHHSPTGVSPPREATQDVVPARTPKALALTRAPLAGIETQPHASARFLCTSYSSRVSRLSPTSWGNSLRCRL